MKSNYILCPCKPHTRITHSLTRPRTYARSRARTQARAIAHETSRIKKESVAFTYGLGGV